MGRVSDAFFSSYTRRTSAHYPMYFTSGRQWNGGSLRLSVSGSECVATTMITAQDI